MKVILASASPRRRELIAKIDGLEVSIVPSNADETVEKSPDPALHAENLALLKARDVYKQTGGVVVGADTVVVLDGRIYGKPKSETQAREFLRELCGRTHEVVTGVAVVCDGGEIKIHETTRVTLAARDDKAIDAYVATGSPMDKAGAYGIQDEAFAPLKKSVDGDIDNVIGLPVALLAKILKEKIG